MRRGAGQRRASIHFLEFFIELVAQGELRPSRAADVTKTAPHWGAVLVGSGPVPGDRHDNFGRTAAAFLNGLSPERLRGAPHRKPYHPMTQGKIERWHLSLKSRILLENYYLPGDLERAVSDFVEHYNHHRYHESLDNLTPAAHRLHQPIAPRNILPRITVRARQARSQGLDGPARRR